MRDSHGLSDTIAQIRKVDLGKGERLVGFDSILDKVKSIRSGVDAIEDSRKQSSKGVGRVEGAGGRRASVGGGRGGGVPRRQIR